MKLKIVLVVSALVFSLLGWVASRPTVTAPSSAPATVAAKQPLYYSCPMHPTIQYHAPGTCPICGMKLVPVYTNDSNAQAASGAGCCAAPENTATNP